MGMDRGRGRRRAAVLTISNQITSGVDHSPVEVDKRWLRNLGLYHLSWWRVLTEAIVQHRHVVSLIPIRLGSSES